MKRQNLKYLLYLICFGFIINITEAQIPPGYYDDAVGLTGDELKDALHDIIKDHDPPSYDDLRDFILKVSDEDPNNPNNVILLYSGISRDKDMFGGGVGEWNREHVWAKSHGDFGNNPPSGTDVHHIRPTDVQVNEDRGNLDFDYSDNPYPGIEGCFYDSNSWEPRDEVKGDVARMIFYMATRYEGENGELDLVVVDEVNTYPNPEHGKLSALLEWNELDPPSEFEETRNDRIYDNWQGNRNPFVDHPEFADLIWDETSIQNEYFTENRYNLSNYPNPFNPSTTISFSLTAQQTENTEIIIYNVKGQKIRKYTLLNNQSLFLYFSNNDY